MIPRNAFLIDNELHWFDQEWTLENVPARHILYRGLKEVYASFPEISSTLSLRTVAEHYNLVDIYTELDLIDTLFWNHVLDLKHTAASIPFRNSSHENCRINIKKILIP